MKKYTFLSLVAVLFLSLTSCEAVDAVFTAGKWWGILVAAALIGLFLFLFRGRGR